MLLSWQQGCDAQIVVTRDRIIPAADVTSEAGDDHRLTVMLDRTRADVEAVLSLLFGPC